MVCVLTLSCSCARPHTRQPSLGGGGASPEIRAAKRPLRFVPTQLVPVRMKLLRQAERQPARSADNAQTHARGAKGSGPEAGIGRLWLMISFFGGNQAMTGMLFPAYNRQRQGEGTSVQVCSRHRHHRQNVRRPGLRALQPLATQLLQRLIIPRCTPPFARTHPELGLGLDPSHTKASRQGPA